MAAPLRENRAGRTLHRRVTSALPAVCAAVCLAVFAANLPALARGPADLAGGSPGLPGPGKQTPPSPQEPARRFERLSIAEGLSQSTVTAILQDSQGWMWFGTEGGLNRYDGYTFVVYEHDPDDATTLAGNEVNALYEDQGGALWIGTNAGLDRFDRETETFSHFQHDPADPDSLGVGSVLCVYEDSAGGLWVGTTGGLSRLEEDGASFAHYEHEPADPTTLSSGAVWVIAEDRENELWIGTNGGLDRYDRGGETFVRYGHDPDDPRSLGDNRVRAVLQDRQGAVWVGTDGGGLERFDPSGGSFAPVPLSSGGTERGQLDSPETRVTAILEDGEGRLWVGTDSGLELLDPQRDLSAHYRHDPSDDSSLSDDLVLSLYEDRSGVLWVGTRAGLNKLDRTAGRFQLYQQGPDGLSDDLVQAVCEDREGALWVGTFAGGLERIDRATGEHQVYRHDPDDLASLSSDDVRAIYEDGQGGLWVGTDLGLDRYDLPTGTFVHYPDLGRIRVTVISEGRSGDLWIGTSGGLYRFDRSAGESATFHACGLSGTYVLAILESQAGLLWVATYAGGIDLLDGEGGPKEHFQHLADDPRSLGHDTVLAFYEDPDEGAVWIGTEQGGLDRFDPAAGTFTHYTEADGLPGNSVACILADAGGTLWLSTDKGLSRFDPEEKTFQNYSARDGLQTGEFVPGACFQSARGEIFVGGFEGLNSFHPEQIQPNTHRPAIVATALDESGGVVRSGLSAGQGIQLSYRDNDISFEFAALDYTAPEKNQYAYRMEPLDEEWVYAGTRRRVDYRNLRPGEYVLQVKGSNNDGVWNEQGIAIAITVTPPVWEAWWFRGLVGLILVGVVLGGYGLRLRSLRAQSRRLERLVGERTSQLEALYRADEELYRHLRLGNVLEALVDAAVDVLEADKSAVLVREEALGEGREGWVVRIARGFSPEAVAQPPLAWVQGAGRAAASGEPVVVKDVAVEGTFAEPGDLAEAGAEAVLPEGIRSFAHFPLQAGGETFGVLSVGFGEAFALDRERQRLFLALAQRASMAIENARLYGQAQELATLEERQRLARDLHDAVTQTLFSTSLIAEVLPRIWERDPDDGRRRLEQVRQATRSALAEMRTLLLELRPAALTETDLGDLLEQLAQAITGRAGVSVSVEVEGEWAPPPEVHVVLYRIAQEALNNVAKHARARRATVCLDREPGRVTLVVRDDGQGFDPDAVPPDRFGIGIMRERAEEIGARLQIRSELGEGTEVELVWEGEGEP